MKSFVERVLSVLVEMRLDEGKVKAENKAKKNAFTDSLASKTPFKVSNVSTRSLGRSANKYGDSSQKSRNSVINQELETMQKSNIKNKDYDRARANIKLRYNRNKPQLP